MKCFLLTLILSSSCFANISLSPSAPLFPEDGLFLAKESFATIKTGYFVDFTYRQHLKNKHQISHAKSKFLSQYGSLCLCLSDLVDLYGFVGSQTQNLSFQSHHVYRKFTGHNLFTWALMADGILNQWGKLQLGAGAFYASTPSQHGVLKTDHLSIKQDYQSYSWGVQLGFCYDYPPISPYVRIDYQYSKAQLSSFKNEFFHVQHPLGLAFGFASDWTHGIFLDAQITLIQSLSAKIFLGIRF